MRLLNVYTSELMEFYGDNIPPYKITSHHWISDECSLEDFVQKRNTESRGYKKIEGFCEFVREDNERLKKHFTNDLTACEWVWIDRCCIDKKSSAEVSESINSMAAWYTGALECVAYLLDVPSHPSGSVAQKDAFSESEWFLRGWTLQELLLPRFLVFLDQDWKIIGHKCAYCTADDSCKDAGPLLNSAIAEVTGIPDDVVQKYSNSGRITVAEKMEWMANRTTTRTEDMAYCMLGIFDVNMSLLYGEGVKAMVRLRPKIAKQQRLAAEEAADTLENSAGTAESRMRQAEQRTERRLLLVRTSAIRPAQRPLYSCQDVRCALSGVSFTRKHDLERHFHTHHREEQLELYDCSVPSCHRRGPYGFTRKDNLRRHMADAHRSQKAAQPRDPGSGGSG